MSDNGTRPRRRVLLITYLYPPYAATGATRLHKFSKYLPDLGWEPHILTPGYYSPLLYSKGNATAPAGVTVHTSANSYTSELFACVLERFMHINPYRWVYPDKMFGWIRPAVRRGLEVVREYDIDVIVASAPPYSTFCVAHRLSRETGIPFVMDYRDAWRGNPYNVFPPRYAVRGERDEREFISAAAHVITESCTVFEKHREFFAIPEGKETVIHNGFDPDDIPENPGSLPEALTITYTGKLYHGKRNPGPFLEGLRTWRSRNKGVPLVVRFVGDSRSGLQAHVERMGLSDVVDVQGHVPYRQAIDMMRHSHLLLLIEGTESLPAKAYEYLACGRPILAFLPPAELADIVRRHAPESSILPPDADPSLVASALDRMHGERSQGGRCIESREAFRREFSRKSKTAALAEVLESIKEASAEE